MNAFKHLAVLLALVNPAYAQMATKLQDIQVPPGRLFQKGYSLTPLNEKGWKIAERNPYQLTLDKPGGNPAEALMIQALIIRLPPFKSNEEFIQQVKDVQVNNISLMRVSLLKYDLRPYAKKGRHCVRSHVAAEERGPLAGAWTRFWTAAGARLTEDELRAFCRGRIASYKIPVGFRFVKDVPRTPGPHGDKVQRGRLREQARADFGGAR